MEFLGVTQELTRLLVHAPSGRPKVLTQAIRRSIVVSAMAARNLRLYRLLPLTAVIGTAALALTLAKGFLEMSGQTAENIGRLPALLLQIVYTLGLLTTLSPFLRKIRWLI